MRIRFNLFISFLLLVVGTSFSLSATNSGNPSVVAKEPFTLEYGKFVVEATVGGHKGRFIVDTGAPTCILKSVADKVGIKGMNKVPFEDSNGKTSEAEATIIPVLGFGGVTFTQVQSIIVENDNVLAHFGVDGIIGYTLFGDKILEIDGRAKEIIVSNDPSRLGLQPEYSMPLVPNPYFLPVVNIPLNGVVETFMFDSGAQSLLEISEESYPRLTEQGAITTLAEGEGFASVGSAGLEASGTKHRVKVDELRLGNLRLQNATSVTTPGTMSRIGAELLRYGKVAIDYSDKFMYLIPYEDIASPQDIYTKEWDIVITAWEDKLLVGIVWGKELLKQVSPGEQIVAINGTRFDEVDAKKAISSGMISMPGEEAKLVILDKNTGKEKEVHIRLR